MNIYLVLDPNLDVWYGEIVYEYADEDCDDPNLKARKKGYSISKSKLGRSKQPTVIAKIRQT